MTINYYSILGVSQNATEDQIRKRFRQLARERHPDRFQGDDKEGAEAAFQAITEAFNVLVNPERRRLHDGELARPAPGPSQGLDRKQLARVYLQRGVKAYREKNFLEAAENFDRGTHEDPDNAQLWHHLARACSHHRRWLSRATAAIARACELEPMNASFLKVAGQIFEVANMPSRAETYYREALKWGGENAEIERRLEELEKASRKGKSGLFGRIG